MRRKGANLHPIAATTIAKRRSHMKSSNWVWLTCLACSLLSSLPLHAAEYPVRTIRFVLPFPPGGGTDTLGRAIGNRLSEGLGQQIVIDNRPGAGANIGAEIAA